MNFAVSYSGISLSVETIFTFSVVYFLNSVSSLLMAYLTLSVD